jgi:hypothetical protein
MKVSTQKMKGILVLIGVLLLSAPPTVFAQDSFYVIPVAMNKPLKNVITVAKANGKFTDPVAAVNSITDASATNPYLVVIGPGVYTITQTLVMKPYVDIAGSGENVTKIAGAISGSLPSSSAIISGATSSTLSSLRVDNTGGGPYSIALSNSSASPTLQNVTITASGGTTNFGIYDDHSSPKMNNVTAIAAGGQYCYAVRGNSSSPTMNNLTAVAFAATQANAGMLFVASSSPVMTNVTIMGDHGVAIYSSSSATISRSTINGSLVGIQTSDGTAKVSQSTIVNGAVGGNIACVACDNGSGKALDGNCNLIP